MSYSKSGKKVLKYVNAFSTVQLSGKQLRSGRYETIFLVSIPICLPSIKISPWYCFNKPVIILINVVFPLPFGPNKPIIFPLGKDKSTWSRALNFP